jgi:magnesium chelatase family protein
MMQSQSVSASNNRLSLCAESHLPSLPFQARGYDRILKVACTIAYLEGSEDLEPGHLFEAVQYRTLDRNLWV